MKASYLSCAIVALGLACTVPSRTRSPKTPSSQISPPESLEASPGDLAEAVPATDEIATTAHETKGLSWIEYMNLADHSVFAASWGDGQFLHVQTVSSNMPGARMSRTTAIVTLNGSVVPQGSKSLACVAGQEAEFRAFSEHVVIAELDGTITVLLPLSWECVTDGRAPRLLDQPREIIAFEGSGRVRLEAKHNGVAHGGNGFLSKHAARFPGVAEDWKRIVARTKVAPRIASRVRAVPSISRRGQSTYRWTDSTGAWQIEFLQWQAAGTKDEKGVGATLYKKQGKRWAISDSLSLEHTPDDDGDTTARIATNSISIGDSNADGVLEASAVFVFGSRTDMSDIGQAMYITEHGKFIKVVEGFTRDFPEESIEVHARDQRDSIKLLEGMYRDLLKDVRFDAWPDGFE